MPQKGTKGTKIMDNDRSIVLKHGVEKFLGVIVQGFLEQVAAVGKKVDYLLGDDAIGRAGQQEF